MATKVVAHPSAGCRQQGNRLAVLGVSPFRSLERCPVWRTTACGWLGCPVSSRRLLRACHGRCCSPTGCGASAAAGEYRASWKRNAQGTGPPRHRLFIWSAACCWDRLGDATEASSTARFVGVVWSGHLPTLLLSGLLACEGTGGSCSGGPLKRPWDCRPAQGTGPSLLKAASSGTGDRRSSDKASPRWARST